jgi:hypothetical protein
MAFYNFSFGMARRDSSVIYILDNEPATIAQWLDDKSLNFMIKDIAQVLCNVHHDLIDDKFFESSKYSEHCQDIRDKWKSEIPLETIFASKTGLLQWSQWARECEANYLYFVSLLQACAHEYRFIRDIKIPLELGEVICWVRNNIPDLPNKYSSCHSCDYGDDAPCVCLETTEFPVIMPKKHIKWTTINGVDDSPLEEESYRNYYQARLKQYIEKSVKKLQGELFQGAKTEVDYDGLWTRREKPKWLSIKG